MTRAVGVQLALATYRKSQRKSESSQIFRDDCKKFIHN